MRLLSLLFIALLAGVFSFASVAETGRKSQSKPHVGLVTPTPRPKSASKDIDRDLATPKPRKEPGAKSTPKASPAGSGGKHEESNATEAAPPARTDATKTPMVTPTPGEKSETKPATPAPQHAPAATLDPADLREFSSQPPRVQQLLSAGLELTKLNLTYTYGSADPARGGMDCSGTMYHLLRSEGFNEVPRDSSGQYAWARPAGFRRTEPLTSRRMRMVCTVL